MVRIRVRRKGKENSGLIISDRSDSGIDTARHCLDRRRQGYKHVQKSRRSSSSPSLIVTSRFLHIYRQILGMVQNMSIFTCPNCSHTTHIFGSEGVSRECQKHDIELLGDIPLDASICADADRGKPTVAAREGPLADAYYSIAAKVIKQLWG